MNLDLRRKNFIEKALMHFKYLTDDYGYDLIEILDTKTSDQIVYESRQFDRRVVIYNSYHPVDYGFEIQWYRPSISTDYPDRKFQLYLLKEDQEDDQEYLSDFASRLRSEYEEVIKGKEWF